LHIIGKRFNEVLHRRADADIKSRELGVLFEDLRVIGLGASASFQPTFGSTLNPLGIIGAIKTMRHPPLRNILTGFEGVVRPGEMLRKCCVRTRLSHLTIYYTTVVLGRPGSGCSTLLKILANQRAEYHAVEGHVDYDSFSPRAIEKHHRGDVQYSPEVRIFLRCRFRFLLM
jgi:ATP-binding cassette subfamily G (WHITE) protein 2 (SNQ2)